QGQPLDLRLGDEHAVKSISSAKGPGERSLPIADLIAPSQADAALTQTSAAAPIARRAVARRRRSSACHRAPRACRATTSLVAVEVSEDLRGQRGVEVVCDPDLPFPDSRLPLGRVGRSERVVPSASRPWQSRSLRQLPPGRRAPTASSL